MTLFDLAIKVERLATIVEGLQGSMRFMAYTVGTMAIGMIGFLLKEVYYALKIRNGKGNKNNGKNITG